MNNSKIWLVVKPTVGVPMFLGAVAIGSFAVHVAVLTNTNWVSNFLKGESIMNTAAIEAPAPEAVAAVRFEDGFAGDAQAATVTLSDGRTGRVVFDAPAQQTALAPAR